MRILVDSMPEKTDSCPYADRVPFSHPRTFVCRLNPDRDVCRGVGKCPVFISYDELMNKKYERNCYKPVADKMYDGRDFASIDNYYNVYFRDKATAQKYADWLNDNKCKD